MNMPNCHLIWMNLMTYLRSVNTSIIGVFFCYGASYFGPTNTNHAKKDQKNLSGHFLGKPPKMLYNALQCTAM